MSRTSVSLARVCFAIASILALAAVAVPASSAEEAFTDNKSCQAATGVPCSFHCGAGDTVTIVANGAAAAKATCGDAAPDCVSPNGINGLPTCSESGTTSVGAEGTCWIQLGVGTVTCTAAAPPCPPLENVL